MTALPRIKPDPLPAIHPLPDYSVTGQRQEWYEDMKVTLQVPWMGVVTMAFAHYPAFFECFWNGLKPLARSRAFVTACAELRSFVEAEVVAQLDPPAIDGRLSELGYAERELAQIGEINDIFSHGNSLYVVLATCARWLLEAGEMAGANDAPIFEGRHAPDVTVPLVLMEAHHADAPTRAVYEDIRNVLGLPFVNTDYRAFARWPSYFAEAWGDLRKVAGTPAHEAICQSCHDQLVTLVAQALPNPGGLRSQTLIAAAAKDAPLSEIREVVRLFQWLLPGLMTNVGYLRAQLVRH